MSVLPFRIKQDDNSFHSTSASIQSTVWICGRGKQGGILTGAVIVTYVCYRRWMACSHQGKRNVEVKLWSDG